MINISRNCKKTQFSLYPARTTLSPRLVTFTYILKIQSILASLSDLHKETGDIL